MKNVVHWFLFNFKWAVLFQLLSWRKQIKDRLLPFVQKVKNLQAFLKCQDLLYITHSLACIYLYSVYKYVHVWYEVYMYVLDFISHFYFFVLMMLRNIISINVLTDTENYRSVWCQTHYILVVGEATLVTCVTGVLLFNK